MNQPNIKHRKYTNVACLKGNCYFCYSFAFILLLKEQQQLAERKSFFFPTKTVIKIQIAKNKK